MAARRAGIANFAINGVFYEAIGDLRWSATTRTREAQINMDGSFAGYSEKGVAPYIKVKLRDAAGLSVRGFQDMTGVQVVSELANGKVVSGYDMTCMEAVEVNSTEDGGFELNFMGPEVLEN